MRKSLKRAVVGATLALAALATHGTPANAATPVTSALSPTVSYHLLTPADGDMNTFIYLLSPKVSKTYLNATLYPRTDNADYEADHTALTNPAHPYCKRSFVRHTSQKIIKWTCKNVPRAEAYDPASSVGGPTSAHATPVTYS